MYIKNINLLVLISHVWRKHGDDSPPQMKQIGLAKVPPPSKFGIHKRSTILSIWLIRNRLYFSSDFLCHSLTQTAYNLLFVLNRIRHHNC